MSAVIDFEDVKDDEVYNVDILKTVQWGRMWLRPHDDNVTLKGKVIKEFGSDVVGNIRPVTD